MASSVPSLPPPPSDGDRNRGDSVLIIETLFVAIGTVLVLVRFYVRSFIKRKVGLDDIFILPGLVSMHLLWMSEA